MFKIIIIIFILQLFFNNPCVLGENFVLDMHVHAAGIGAGESGCFISSDFMNSLKFKFYLKAYNTTLEEVEKHGDSIIISKISDLINDSEHVDAAIVLALDAVIDTNGEVNMEMTQFFVPNDYLKEETDKYDNLYYGPSIHPNRKDAIERLVQAKNDGGVLVKLHPPVQIIDPGDEKYIPFYEKAKELDLPILIHVGKSSALKKAYNNLADPNKLILPLEIGVTVIAAHVGAGGFFEGDESHKIVLRLMKKYDNLFSDISSTTFFHRKRIIKDILDNDDLMNRFLYGSDYPLINSTLIQYWIFIPDITLKKYLALRRIKNPLDKDIVLKSFLNFPEKIWLDTASFFNIH